MYFVIGRVTFSAYTSVKKVRSSGGRCQIVPCLIFFFSDDNSNDTNFSVQRFSLQHESELPSITDDETSPDE